MTGKLALSKFGHDKNHLYVIVREEEEYVFLADGKLKSVEKPKKKNKKHIQIIKALPEPVRKILQDKENIGDLEAKRAIRLYVRINPNIEKGQQHLEQKQEGNACQKQM